MANNDFGSLQATLETSTPSMTTINNQLQRLLSLWQPNDLSVSFSVNSFTSGPLGIPQTDWVFDSGATHHMTNDSSLFASTFSLPYVSVLVENGS